MQKFMREKVSFSMQLVILWVIFATSGMTVWILCKFLPMYHYHSSRCSGTDKRPLKQVYPQVRATNLKAAVNAAVTHAFWLMLQETIPACPAKSSLCARWATTWSRYISPLHLLLSSHGSPSGWTGEQLRQEWHLVLPLCSPWPH